MAPTSNAAPIRNPVVFAPHIYDHSFDTVGYPVFHVEMGNGDHFQMREHEMPANVLEVLDAYKETVSRVRFNDQFGGYYEVAQILTHRVDQTGQAFFLIAWTGTFAHPIWRQEVREELVCPVLVGEYRARHHI